MSDIHELGGRITVALDRIRSSVDTMGQAAPSGDADDNEVLQTMLDEERTANAQLEERVKALKERQDTNMTAMETRLGSQADEIATLSEEIDRLRASNAELSASNAELKSAASSDGGQAEMINRATMAELEALQAQRAADAAEVDAILNEIKPLIEEA